MKQQISNRLGVAHVRDTMMQFVTGAITRQQAMESLQVGQSQRYSLRTSYLAARAQGRGDDWEPGSSGGNHMPTWPDKVQSFLRRALEPDGDAKRYSYAFAASEVGRRFGFPVGRSQVRHWAIAHNLQLADHRARPPAHVRRWQRKSVGELWQLDATPDYFLGRSSPALQLIDMVDDCSRMQVGCRLYQRETVASYLDLFYRSFTRYGLPLEIYVDKAGRISGDLQFRRQENMGLSMDRFHKSLFYLSPFSRITRRHEITCRHRGYYDCSLASIVAGDLFGVAHDRADVMGDARLFVYPAILKPDEMPDTALKWQGDVTVRRWILPDPILVTGIRAYRSGDPQKDVHWRATARTGSLQVKQRDYTVSPRALLVLNCQIADRQMGTALEPKDAEYLEGGVRICASLASWCIRSGVDVGFLTNGESALPEIELNIPPRCSDAQLERILEALAVLKKLSFCTTAHVRCSNVGISRISLFSASFV